jgi:hypothetical protein
MYTDIFEHIKNNKPIFIKSFFSSIEYKESIDEIINLSKQSNNKNNFLKGSNYITTKKNLFIDNILKELKKNKDIIIDNNYRIWNHKKNNITQWHWDGNGIDVINICLKGEKKFILAEPQSQIRYPFTNITLFETHKKEYTYILKPGDLLLIPRFWNHKVISLQNNTITMNFCLTNNYNNIPNNYKMLYNLHNFFNTQMSKENICKLPILFMKIKDFFINLIKENVILFILFLSLRILLKNLLKQKYKLTNNLDIYLIFSTWIEFVYHKSSLGITTLILINTFTNNLLIDYLI